MLDNRAARDSHQRGGKPHAKTVTAHRRPPGQLVGDTPVVAADQELCGDEASDNDEGDLEHRARRQRRDQRAGRNAQHCGNRPGTHHVHHHRAVVAMHQIGAHIRGNDDRERSADAKLHAHLLRHADPAEDLVEHRHDDAAGANAEQAGEDAGDDAAGDDHRCKERKLADGDAADHQAAMCARSPGESATSASASVSTSAPAPGLTACVAKMPAEGACSGHAAEQAKHVAGDARKASCRGQARARYKAASPAPRPWRSANGADSPKDQRIDRRAAATAPDRRRGPSSRRRRGPEGPSPAQHSQCRR